jgi:hypothetical protein
MHFYSRAEKVLSTRIRVTGIRRRTKDSSFYTIRNRIDRQSNIPSKPAHRDIIEGVGGLGNGCEGEGENEEAIIAQILVFTRTPIHAFDDHSPVLTGYAQEGYGY